MLTAAVHMDECTLLYFVKKKKADAVEPEIIGEGQKKLKLNHFQAYYNLTNNATYIYSKPNVIKELICFIEKIN